MRDGGCFTSLPGLEFESPASNPQPQAVDAEAGQHCPEPAIPARKEDKKLGKVAEDHTFGLWGI